MINTSKCSVRIGACSGRDPCMGHSGFGLAHWRPLLPDCGSRRLAGFGFPAISRVGRPLNRPSFGGGTGRGISLEPVPAKAKS